MAAAQGGRWPLDARSVIADREVLHWLQRTGRAGGLAQGQAALVAYLQAERERGRLGSQARTPFIAAGLLGACQHRAFASLVAGSSAPDLPPGLDTDVEEYARQVVATLLTSQLP